MFDTLFYLIAERLNGFLHFWYKKLKQSLFSLYFNSKLKKQSNKKPPSLINFYINPSVKYLTPNKGEGLKSISHMILKISIIDV